MVEQAFPTDPFLGLVCSVRQECLTYQQSSQVALNLGRFHFDNEIYTFCSKER